MTGRASLAAAAGTVFLDPQGATPTPGAETLVRHLVPAGPPIGAANLAVELNIPPGAGDSRTFTIRGNLADTAVTCTISGLTNSCNSGALTDTISGSASFALEVTSTGTPGASEVAFGWRATTP